ncbi:uncharacterized protein VTP21DRAFT_1935 [Calcarisporiella thermophila]|uniref:uncharacterized protein n=1 Tax=Calcarisporiella thermophila TaxID=911321 RepID=UPI003741F4CC
MGISQSTSNIAPVAGRLAGTAIRSDSKNSGCCMYSSGGIMNKADLGWLEAWRHQGRQPVHVSELEVVVPAANANAGSERLTTPAGLIARCACSGTPLVELPSGAQTLTHWCSQQPLHSMQSAVEELRSLGIRASGVDTLTGVRRPLAAHDRAIWLLADAGLRAANDWSAREDDLNDLLRAGRTDGYSIGLVVGSDSVAGVGNSHLKRPAVLQRVCCLASAVYVTSHQSQVVNMCNRLSVTTWAVIQASRRMFVLTPFSRQMGPGDPKGQLTVTHAAICKSGRIPLPSLAGLLGLLEDFGQLSLSALEAIWMPRLPLLGYDELPVAEEWATSVYRLQSADLLLWRRLASDDHLRPACWLPTTLTEYSASFSRRVKGRGTGAGLKLLGDALHLVRRHLSAVGHYGLTQIDDELLLEVVFRGRLGSRPAIFRSTITIPDPTGHLGAAIVGNGRCKWDLVAAEDGPSGLLLVTTFSDGTQHLCASWEPGEEPASRRLLAALAASTPKLFCLTGVAKKGRRKLWPVV